MPLPPGLRESEQLPEPIFTPATKAETGHDENISFDVMAELHRRTTWPTSCATAASTSTAGPPSTPRERGIILADTKFEWGQLPDGRVILIDEVLTPDSSRFWPADQYQVGGRPPSFDKQFVRDWLEATGWDKNSPPPELPAEVVERTAAKYREAFERLTK